MVQTTNPSLTLWLALGEYTIQIRSHYEPFGKRLGGDKAGIGYTGHLQDEDLNLTYMQARYYDPVIGRFYSNKDKWVSMIKIHI